jgi:methionine biosynthesis protein MetW
MSKKTFEEHYWGHHTQQLEERHKLALELIGNPESLIDLGCGDGFFLQHAKAQRKAGLEMSETAVQHAKKKGLDVRLFDFENDEIPFKDNEFEIATMLDVLEHTFQPDIQLRNAARVAKKIVITVPNFAFLTFRLQALFGKVPMVLGERKGHCFYFTRKKLHEICKRAGIRIIEEKHYFPLMRVPVIGMISALIGKIFPGLLATEFAVLGEKK